MNQRCPESPFDNGTADGAHPASPIIPVYSCTVQAHEWNYVNTELEALVAVWGVKHFQQYLCGHNYTDREALKSLQNTQVMGSLLVGVCCYKGWT